MTTNKTFRTAEEEAVLARTEAALAKGEDPFGDDEPIVILDNDHQLEAEGNTAAAAKTEGKTEGEGESEGDPPADDAAAAAAAAAKPGADASKAEGEDEGDADDDTPDDEPAAPEPFVPQFRGKPVDDFAKKRSDLRAEEAAIDKRWSAGEISDEERATQVGAVRDKLDDLLIQHTRSTTLNEANEQTQATLQANVIKRMVEASQGQKLDYSTDEAARDEFDAALDMVAKIPGNAKLGFEQLVEKAHHVVLFQRGLFEPKAAPAPAPAAKADPPARATPEPPPSLRGVPAASVSNTGGGLGEQLGRLKGQDFQEAVGKMPKAQRDAWLDS